MVSRFGVLIASPKSFVTCAWEPAEKEDHAHLVAGAGGAIAINMTSNQTASQCDINFSGLRTAFSCVEF
jgi:hypothetical protein